MTTLTAEQNDQLRQIAGELTRMEREAETLRSLLTDNTPGAVEIYRDQRRYLTAARDEIAKVRAGALWDDLNDHLSRSHNTTGLVSEMIDSIRHPQKVDHDLDAIDHLP